MRSSLSPIFRLPALLLALSAGFAGGEGMSYRGTAVDVRSGKAVFTEEHAEERVEGRVLSMRSTYRDLSGAVIAERTLDYSASPYLPRYRLKDYRTGLEEGAAREGGRILVFHRARSGKPLRRKRLRVPEPAVVDGGFNSFLKRNWGRLGEGNRLSFNVVVPSRQAYYRFTAYEDREKSKPGLTKVIVAVPENRLVRMVAPRIELTYDAKTRRMTRFHGISNVPGPDGGTMTVELNYPEGGP